MTAQSASKETTLDLVDRQVETPVCAARRRRYWLVWWLWAVFGAAVSFRGMPAGGLLIAAAVLTAPFWVLFAAWPILWLRDRRRSKTLWAEETAVLLAPNPQQSASDSSADAQGGIALPVILGHERESSGKGILIPMLGWEAAFRRLSPKGWGFTWCRPIRFPGFTCRRSKPVTCSLSLGGTSPLSHLAPRRTTGRRLAVGRSICGRCLPARCSEALRRKKRPVRRKTANRTMQKLYGSGLVRGSLVNPLQQMPFRVPNARPGVSR